MDKFTSIIKNHKPSLLIEDAESSWNTAYNNYKYKTPTELPAKTPAEIAQASWDDAKSTHDERIKDLETPGEGDNLELPPHWNDLQASEFFRSIYDGNILKALGLLINDPSISTTLDTKRIEQTIQEPLDNTLANITQFSAALTNEQFLDIATSDPNATVATEEPAPAATTAPAPAPVTAPESTPAPATATAPQEEQPIDPKLEGLGKELSPIMSNVKDTIASITQIFSEKNLSTAISNLLYVSNKKNNLYDQFEEVGGTAESSGWKENLISLNNELRGNVNNQQVAQKFESIIRKYFNTVQINESIDSAGIAAAIVKYFFSGTATIAVNIIGFLFSFAITMPLKIIMLAFEKLKKYKNFLLSIFMPVQIVSGVIINSGAGPGVFTGPLMQELLQKGTDLILELIGDISKLLGLDKLVQHLSQAGKGLSREVTNAGKAAARKELRVKAP